jgi:hypothetical protein
MATYKIPEGETFTPVTIAKRKFRGRGKPKPHQKRGEGAKTVAKPKQHQKRGVVPKVVASGAKKRNFLPPGQAKKVFGQRSARNFAPGHTKRGSMTGPNAPSAPATPRGAGPATKRAARTFLGDKTPKFPGGEGGWKPSPVAAAAGFARARANRASPPSAKLSRGAAASAHAVVKAKPAMTGPIGAGRGARGGFPEQPKNRSRRRPPVSKI